MHGESSRPAACSLRRAGAGKALEVQQLARQHIVERSSLLLNGDCALEPETALRSLLKGRSAYSGASSTTTAPYKSGAVSLPVSVKDSPMVTDLLPPSERDTLVGLRTHMLRPQKEVEAMQEAIGVPGCYHDPIFSSCRPKYVKFVGECVDIGVVRYVLRCRSQLGLFSAKRMGDSDLFWIAGVRTSSS